MSSPAMAEMLIPDSQLDNDIATVRAQIESLRHRRSLLSNTLLSSRKLQSRLKEAKASALAKDFASDAIELAEMQASTNLSNVYRTCAGITAFRIQDPDPNAIDSGHILGIRIDVFSSKQKRFIVPYYLLLNHPETGSRTLKIHKHTIPPFVPLKQLVAKYLPQPNVSSHPVKQGQAQNLPRLVHALRRELVSLHKRVASLEGLHEKLGPQQGVKAINTLDSTGRELDIHFSDDLIARLKIATDGKIESVVARSETRDGESKRQRLVERLIQGTDGGIERLAERLSSRRTEP